MGNRGEKEGMKWKVKDKERQVEAKTEEEGLEWEGNYEKRRAEIGK